MAPYNQAVAVRLAENQPNDRKVYEGTIDPTWNIGNVPCYALALILQSCIQHQASTPHVDPLHISAHFLRPTNSQVPFKVYVQTVKTGKGFSNLVAEFRQEDSVRITSHAIFGVNGPTDDMPDLTLKPPSSYARRHPLYLHPSEGERHPMRNLWNFHKHIAWAYDDKLTSLNAPDHPSRTNSSTVGGGGLEWGGYLQFESPTERLTNAYIPFLADMFINTINLLPKSEFGSGLGTSWFPTMTLAIEFKFPISQLDPSNHSMRNVGLYSLGRFVNNPQRRHDVYVEVWSAPSNIGEGEPQDGWRDEQFCLATATQMALTVPIALNIKNGKKKTDSKL
ncbi:hypothetical protein H1R20_g9608, partial [Candolleomyces eurysporus]